MMGYVVVGEDSTFGIFLELEDANRWRDTYLPNATVMPLHVVEDRI